MTPKRLTEFFKSRANEGWKRLIKNVTPSIDI